MEIQELLKNIKDGDEKSFEELLKMHQKMIYKIIYTIKLEKGDYCIDIDSLYQEGSIALYKAVFSFEENTAMSFTSYAYMVIRSRIMTYVRDNYRYLEQEYFSIDNCDNMDYQIKISNLVVSEDPISYHREKQFEEHLDSFIKKLTNEDKEIFRLRSENYTYKQISERLHIKTKKIDNRLRVLRERLKKHMKQEDKND